MNAGLERDLRQLLGAKGLRDPADPAAAAYLTDATESRAIRGRADAIALPADAHEVTETVRYCARHGLAVVPRGGGTGYAGGAVPLDGGIVLSLERLDAVLAFEPERWRAQLGAGMITATLQRRARESGVWFPPDPGAAGASQLGGNVATNAGGPHSFKYGVTRAWVTGVEAVLAPGELARFGGSVRKDVGGYDLTGLMVGSEGTLGIVTAVWLRLMPAPEVQLPVLAAFHDLESGCAAVDAVFATGAQPATLEYLDGMTLRTAAAAGLPPGVDPEAGLVLIAEADGSEPEALALRDELRELFTQAGATAVHAPADRGEVRELWRWRGAVSRAVTASRGGKVSEDIVVPAGRLLAALQATGEIGKRHGLETCSWGHAGDGNLHSSFLIDPEDGADLERAGAAARALFKLAAQLGGAISGEHGVGVTKRGALARQWEGPALARHEAIKAALDPGGLFNPGKKLAR